jgi:hypothetical protein
MWYIVAPAVLALLLTVVHAQEPTSNRSDDSCSGAAEPLTGFDGLKIVVTCESEGSRRTMYLSVTNTAPLAQRELRGFALGFCGADAVIDAESPTGWVVEVTRREPRTTVSWNVARGEPRLGAGQQADGFVVRLRPGWRRSGYEAARWRTAGGASGGSVSGGHDCVGQIEPTR